MYKKITRIFAIVTIILSFLFSSSVFANEIAQSSDPIETIVLTETVMSTEPKQPLETEKAIDAQNNDERAQNDNNIMTAIIALIGVVIGALLSGIFQIFLQKQSLKNANKQFGIQMEQTRKEFSTQIEQMQEEHKRLVSERVNTHFNATSERFYNNAVRELVFYDSLLNELHYLNNLSAPSQKQERLDIGVYPLVSAKIEDMVGDIEVPQNLAKLLGALRCRIDFYNSAVNSRKADSIESTLASIHSLINPINSERFDAYASAQKAVRDFELRKGKEELERNGLIKD